MGKDAARRLRAAQAQLRAEQERAKAAADAKKAHDAKGASAAPPVPERKDKRQSDYESSGLDFAGAVEWKAFATRALAAGFPASTLTSGKHAASEAFRRQIPFKEVEFAIFEDTGHTITQAMVSALGATMTEDDPDVTVVTKRKLDAAGLLKTNVHNARQARSDKAPEGPEEQDPLCAMSKTVMRRPERAYTDPQEEMDARSEQIGALHGIPEDVMDETTAAVGLLLADVLGRYNASKAAKPFIKTGANVLLCLLAGAHERRDNEVFRKTPKGAVSIFWNVDLCAKAAGLLKSAVVGSTKLEKGIARLEALLDGVRVQAYSNPEMGLVDSLSYPRYVGSTPTAAACNLVLDLCSYCDRRGRNDSIESTFQGVKFRTAETCRERPWIDLAITQRIDQLARLDKIPRYAMSGELALRGVIDANDSNGDQYGFGIPIQPALGGFRCYMGNIKGHRSLVAARITAATAATYERVKGGPSLNRLDAFKTAVGSVPYSQADKLLFFLMTCQNDDFGRVIDALTK